jgi:RNA polymerase sigma factor (sigma-70 family)
MAVAQVGTLLWQIQRMRAGRDAAIGTDHQLLEDFAARRDEAAFAALVARHGSMVLRVCQRVLGHEQDAEDAFQAAFLILAQSGTSLRKREALADWLHGVAYRTALKAKRTAARRHRHEARLRTRTPLAAPCPSWDEVQAVLDEEIRRLPGPFRAAFTLCVLEGRSGRQAAAALGCKEKTVSSRLTRARQRLQRRLARRGINLAALLAALSIAESAGKAAVPAVLARAAVRGGLLAVAGESAGPMIPSPVAALAAGVTKAMFRSRARMTVIAVFAAGLLALGAGVLARQDHGPEDAPPLAPREPAGPAAARGDEDATVVVSGRVLDPDGKPVPGAQVYCVRLMAYRRESPPPPPPAQATTTADGSFCFRIAKKGFQTADERKWWSAVTLTGVAAGHGVGWNTVVKPEALRDVTIALVKDDVPVNGRVVDLEGKPIRGVTVRVTGLLAPTGLLDPAVVGLGQPVVTGADGRFRLTGIGRDRKLSLRFDGPTIETRVEVATTRPGSAGRLHDGGWFPPGNSIFGATFDHAAAPTKPVVGVVRDRDTGKPLAGVTIQGRVAGLSSAYLHTTTDARGHYRLVGLARAGGQDIYAIPAAGQPYLASARTVGHSPGLDPVAVDFALRRGVLIRGRVTDKATGQPVRARVEYFVFVTNPHLRDAPGFAGSSGTISWTGDDGAFTLVGLPGRGLVAARDVDPDRFIAAAGADRIAGADARGLFRTHPHICMPINYHTLVEVNPAKGAEGVTCNVALDPGKTITGLIVGPDGKPVEGVSIEGSWRMPHAYRQEVLPTARFTLTAINPRDARPFFFRRDDRDLGAAVSFTGDERMPVTVRLQRCATLTGRVVDEDGRPRARLQVTGEILKGQLNLAEGWYGFLWATTDGDGRFRIEHVIPGVRVGLAIQSGAGITGRLVPELVLKAGETRNLGDIRGREVQ